jgi:hypothetical protein
MRRTLAWLALWPCFLPCIQAQTGLVFAPGVSVARNGEALSLAWAGGLNDPQVSPIDLNGDGLQDLLLFDRTGSCPVFLLNVGQSGQAEYTVTHAYDSIMPFPLLHDWALLRDYNCDGKQDVFAYTNSGFAVYRNTSQGTDLSFALTDNLVGSNYVPTYSPNLFVSYTDLPGIEDIDGDGDLDILTFSIDGSTFLEYHKNFSMEEYGTCDSLNYEVRTRCWGQFLESPGSSAITLDVVCSYNVPNPEAPYATGPHGELQPSPDRHHSGSTILPLDLNGDGVKDLLIGDLTYPRLHALTNDGSTTHAHMAAQDSLFPAYDQTLDLDQFVAPYFVDIDGDGKRDLVAAPNSVSQSENAKSVWYYLNTGTDAVPHFTFQQDDLFQDRMLDFGEGARPVPFDHNGDGLMDLVVANEGYFQDGGTYRGALALLENTGSPTAPAFALVDEDYLGLDGLGYGYGLHPAFGDVDGDGKPDMLLGDQLGNIHYFHNTATGAVAQFQLVPGLVTDDGGQPMDVGLSATPQLFDVDGDGLLDLLVGERNGNINWYRNAGSATAMLWHLETQDLGGVSTAAWGETTGYSVPWMYLNELGQREFLSGSEKGGIYHYDGLEGNIMGAWNLTDSVWKGFHEGARSAVLWQDLTGDGLPDAVIGNYRGGLSFWSSGYGGVGIQTPGTAAIPGFDLSPNPAQGSTELLLHGPLSGGAWAMVTDLEGRTMTTVELTGPRTRLNVDGWAPGCYLVRIAGSGKQHVRRLVVWP